MACEKFPSTKETRVSPFSFVYISFYEMVSSYRIRHIDTMGRLAYN